MTDENSGESPEDDAKMLYEQLQTEYNKLLKQYAAAENTIDELRTGATVHLYTQPLESRPNSRLSFGSERYPQTITFPEALQASTSSVSAINEACSKNPTGGHSFLSQDKGVKCTTQGENTTQNLTLHARVQALKEDVNTVECLLSENAVNEGLNEVVVICTQLRKEHGALTHELKLQSQNVNTSHLSQCDINHLCTKTELGKELYRIGLRVDEIQRDVTVRIKAKNAVSNNKSVKPQNDDKPLLNSDIQILIKEMKDLKDASIRSSEEVLNSSRMESMKSENDSPFKTSSKRSSKEQGRHSELEHDIVDSQYFSASPVNLEFDPQNILSGSEGSVSCGEQLCNVTWPLSRNRARVDIDGSNTRHSFLETTEDYGYDSVKSSQRSLNSAHDHKSFDSEPSWNAAKNKRRTNPNEQLATSRSISDRVKVNKGESDQVQLPANRLKSNQGPKIPQNTEGDRTETFGTHSKPEDSTRHSWEKHSSQFAHDLHKRKAKRHSENTPNSDDDTSHIKDKQSPLPKHPENCHQGTKHRRSRSSDGNPGPEQFNSLSSLADSSRMSTPLFQPRAAMRHSPPRYKRRNLSDGFDSGFVGSEASRSSRLTTGHPDGIQKLNVSNQLDSSLHLDFVSEMDEYEFTSPEKVSTTYEDGLRSPRETIRSPQYEDSNFINSSPSPPSSTGRTPAKYLRTSRTRFRCGETSSPGCDAGHSDQSSSSDSERHSSDRRSFSEHTSGFEGKSTKTMDKARIRYSGSGTRDVAPEVTDEDSDKVKSEDKTNEAKNERKLQALRDELDSLHHHVNELDDTRDIMGRYDELRHRDEQLRRVQEGRNERKLDDLRQTIEQLKRDIKLRYRSENRRRKPDLNPEFYDDFRRELRHVTDKLDELTNLRSSVHGPSVSPYTHVSSNGEDDDIAKRFSNLVRKVDELRLRIENGSARENSRYFCRHCNEVGGHHHGNGTVNTADHQPQISTPFPSDIHRTSRQTTVERSHLSSTYPGAYQYPVVHHVHTYHRDPRIKQHIVSESSSDEDNYVKRTPLRRRSLHRSRYRSRRDISNYDHFSLDDARKAARDVQRLSKNILNSITLDLTSLRS